RLLARPRRRPKVGQVRSICADTGARVCSSAGVQLICGARCYKNFCGAAGGIRTHDIQNHNLALLPTELQPPCRSFSLTFEARLELCSHRSRKHEHARRIGARGAPAVAAWAPLAQEAAWRSAWLGKEIP